MDPLLDSYVTVGDTIKRSREHLNQLRKKRDEFAKKIYKHMIKNDLEVLEYKNIKIKLRDVKPLEVKRKESLENKQKKRERIISKVKQLSENPDSIMEIIFEEFRMKKEK